MCNPLNYYIVYRAIYPRLGAVDLNTVEKVEVVIREEDKIRQERFTQRPALSEILNLHDFEVRIKCLVVNERG